MAIKILFVITKANWGGAQRYVYDLANAANAAEYDVVVAYGDEGELVQRLAEVGVRTIRIASLTRGVGLFHEIRSFFSLLRILRAEHPDVVHVNSSKASGLGCLAARIVGIHRIIFTAHGWAFNETRPWWQKLIIYKLVWLTIAFSHKTICVSKAIRRDVVWMPFVRGKLVVIYNGTSREEYLARDEARKTLSPHLTAPYWIGMMSELHPTKRVEDALRAFAMIATKHPDTALLVMGAGKERERLEQLITELDLHGRAFLLGHIKNAPKYLKAFDLFIHTSQSEALGLAILEAGCAALPVVATKVGGIPEIIPDDDHGLLVPARDPEALAAAIESLILDKQRAAELGARLHARVQNSFSKQKMVSETLALYKN